MRLVDEQQYRRELRDDAIARNERAIHAARRWTRHDFWPFLDSYLAAARWTENMSAQFAPDARTLAYDECLAFADAHMDDLFDYAPRDAGHDLWLTRNSHGAGYWDGDYAEPAASRLTDAAHALGEVWLYQGDDGRLHFTR